MFHSVGSSCHSVLDTRNRQNPAEFCNIHSACVLVAYNLWLVVLSRLQRKQAYNLVKSAVYPTYRAVYLFTIKQETSEP